MEIFKEFTFEAGHRLPNVQSGAPVRAAPMVTHFESRCMFEATWTKDPGGLSTSPSIKSAFKPLLEQLDLTTT